MIETAVLQRQMRTLNEVPFIVPRSKACRGVRLD
jgi:hypothetical protein